MVVVTRRFGSWEAANLAALGGTYTPPEPSAERVWTTEEVMDTLREWMTSHPDRMDRFTYRRYQEAFNLPPIPIVYDLVTPNWSDVIQLVKTWKNSKRLLEGGAPSLRREVERVRSTSRLKNSLPAGDVADAVRRISAHLDDIPDL